MKRFVFILLFLSMEIYCAAVTLQSVEVEDICSYEKVLDEWRKPGLYSPVNILDGDIITCYAEGVEQNYIGLKIVFKQPVYIDEIRVMNGNCRSAELFNKYNRAAKLGFNFYSDEAYNREVEPVTEKFVLRDRPEFQSIRLKNSYRVRMIELFNYTPAGNIYKGIKYNDTCLTELEFYYNGRKVEIKNISRMKEKYISGIQQKLVDILSDKKFFIDEDAVAGEMITYRDGHIEYRSETDLAAPVSREAMPCRWKVEDSMLYMKSGEEWLLFNYELFENSLVLYPNPDTDVPEDFVYNPNDREFPKTKDYQIIMSYKEDLKRDRIPDKTAGK